MIKLQIRKQNGNIWKHIKVDENNDEFILSKFTARWNKTSMEVTEISGVDNARYDISEIAVYDDTDLSVQETFTSILTMAIRLKALGYTAFQSESVLIIADLISSDGSNAIELGTDGLLYAQSGVGLAQDIQSVLEEGSTASSPDGFKNIEMPIGDLVSWEWNFGDGANNESGFFIDFSGFEWQNSGLNFTSNMQIFDGEFAFYKADNGTGDITLIDIIDPVSSANIRIPAPLVGGLYNIPLIITDGVSDVSADVNGLVDISSLLVSGSGVTSVGINNTDGLLTVANTPITTSGDIDLDVDIDALSSAIVGENLSGTALFSSIGGIQIIDMSTAEDFYFSLNNNLNMSVSNTPALAEGFVRTFTIKSSVAETLTLPVSWTVIGTYDNSGVENYLTVKFSNTVTTGLLVLCEIYQA